MRRAYMPPPGYDGSRFVSKDGTVRAVEDSDYTPAENNAPVGGSYSSRPEYGSFARVKKARRHTAAVLTRTQADSAAGIRRVRTARAVRQRAAFIPRRREIRRKMTNTSRPIPPIQMRTTP